MVISSEDYAILKTLCADYGVNPEKVKRLLEVIKRYELQDRRSGVFEELEAIIKQKDDFEEQI